MSALHAPPSNGDVAQIFQHIADVLELQGENTFKVRAYRNAVETLQSLPEPVTQIATEGRLDDIPGFGEAIRGKVADILKTGTTPLYERTRNAVPAGVLAMLTLPGIGAKTVRQLWEGLKVESIDALAEAARSGKVAALPGMGAKTAEKILGSIDRARRYGERLRIDVALALAENILTPLRHVPGLTRVEYAGSLRRGVDTIGDLDFVGVTLQPKVATDAFVALPQVARIIKHGDQMARVQLHQGIEADLKLTEPEHFGALLHHFTGSRAHNIHLRRIAELQGLSINEYGVWRGDVALPLGDGENALYGALGLPTIPVHLREDRGEIEAAEKGELPHLIALSDIRGDVHAHTTASDGAASIEEMAQAARALGYEYMAITDHSQGLTIAGGLTPGELREQICAIRKLEDSLGIAIFAGSEVDIKADGALDFDDELLAELDFVIASAHRFNNQDTQAQTARLIRAIENPNVDLIAHPSGRLINRRDPYAVDWEAVMDAADRTATALEINAAPERLDLNDILARSARDRGVKIIINTDAHSIGNYGLMHYGITIARRAWLRAEDVLNTLPLQEFRAWLNR